MSPSKSVQSILFITPKQYTVHSLSVAKLPMQRLQTSKESGRPLYRVPDLNGCPPEKRETMGRGATLTRQCEEEEEEGVKRALAR